MGKRKREEDTRGNTLTHKYSGEIKAHDDAVRIHARLEFGHTRSTVFIKMKN